MVQATDLIINFYLDHPVEANHMFKTMRLRATTISITKLEKKLLKSLPLDQIVESYKMSPVLDQELGPGIEF